MNNNRRGFSLYDIEQFLREAGAEKVNEKAVISLQKELSDTVKELVEEASVYANYAGRSRMIKRSDLALISGKRRMPGPRRRMPMIGRENGTANAAAMNRHMRKRQRIAQQVVEMLH